MLGTDIIVTDWADTSWLCKQSDCGAVTGYPAVCRQSVPPCQSTYLGLLVSIKQHFQCSSVCQCAVLAPV